MGIEEIFTNYIRNMEDDRYKGYYAFTDPYTTRNFIQLFNFNDPEVEKKWIEASYTEECVPSIKKKGVDIEGHEYLICYL